MVGRKTQNAEELHAALSAASRARRTFRGGRPRKAPTATAKLGAADLVILRKLAATRGEGLRDLVHLFATVAVRGGRLTFTPRPELAEG